MFPKVETLEILETLEVQQSSSTTFISH
jgi:hypothetical protein